MTSAGQSDRVSGDAVAGFAFGDRLRERRLAQGLTLRELARRLEVSASLVSQIETGKITPSVRTLYAIVNELTLSFDELFADADGSVERPVATQTPASVTIQRSSDRPAIDLEAGVRWERLAIGRDAAVDFLYAVYAVGGAASQAGTLVRHNGREFGIVLKGRLGLTLGFDDYTLEAGDSVAFDSSTPHRLYNDGLDEAIAVWLVLVGDTGTGGG